MARRAGRGGVAGAPAVRARRVLAGWAGAAHPYPVFMVVSLTALIAVVSSRPDTDAGALLLAVAAMLCSQVAIGWTNDYVDRESDAVHQPDKPVASGLVEARHLPPAVGAALAASLAAGVALGPLALALLAFGTGMGMAYNFWFKDTRLSWLPYVLAFAVLPPFAWAAVDAFERAYWSLYAIGLPLVVAVHIANSLPDVESDRLSGRRGLAASLGPGRSLLLLAGCLGLAPAVALLLATRLDVAWRLFLAAVAVAAAVGAAGSLASVHRGSADLGFRLVALSAVVLAIGWLAALRSV